jgi:hypothetical protein
MFFQDNNPSRSNILRGRIVNVNLQGRGYKGYFIKKQIIETLFTIELSFGLSENHACIRWTSCRSLDEFKTFYDTLVQHPKIKANGSRFIATFPVTPSSSSSSNTEIDDVMALVERKEGIDLLLKEILAKIDYAVYLPLKDFLRMSESPLAVLERRMSVFQRRFRRMMSKRKFNQVLHDRLRPTHP